MTSARRVQHGHAGHDLVRPAAEGLEHRPRLGAVGRLAERPAVDHHDRVGGDDQPAAPRRGDGAGLPERERRDGLRQGDGLERLVRVARHDLERQAERGEQLAAARGGGGKNQARGAAHRRCH